MILKRKRGVTVRAVQILEYTCFEKLPFIKLKLALLITPFKSTYRCKNIHSRVSGLIIH